MGVMVENLMPKLRRVVMQDDSRDVAMSVARTLTLPLPDGCAPDCELPRELLARKCGSVALAIVGNLLEIVKN
jgi:hypothetical protein